MYQYIGISVLNRRKELQKQENLPIGPREIVNIYMDIKGNEFRQSLSENEIREKYPNLTIQEKNNITEFIEKIQNKTLDANDLREMQEIYANIEWKNDNNIYHKLFRKYKLKKSRRAYIRKRINSIYI